MVNNKLKNNPILEEYFKNPRFPLLYKDSTNGLRVWACWIIKNILYRTDGLVTGKLKNAYKKEIEGNTLRSCNEQALQEGEKLWIQQLDKGYKPAENDKNGQEIYKNVIAQKEANGGMNRQVKMFITNIDIEKSKTTAGQTNFKDAHPPMLAQSYLEQKEELQFPVLVDPKLDGERVIVYLNSEKQVRLESRNGKEFMFNNHIREAIRPILEKYKIILDGELYIHELYSTGKDIYNTEKQGKKLACVERYQFISKTCKISRKEPYKYENLGQLWIFDIYDLEKSANERKKLLQKIFNENEINNDIIKLVPFKKVNSSEEIDDCLDFYTKNDFEGIMIRKYNDLYISKKGYHCKNMLKLKKFIDEEFPIVGAKASTGAQKNAIVWEVEKDGKKFFCKQVGNLESSKELWHKFQKNPNKFIGKMLNVRFNELTKEKIPRFARATSIVEDK